MIRYTDTDRAAIREAATIVARSDPSPPQWWYLSFVDTAVSKSIPWDERRPGGPSWLGACWVDAPNYFMAAARAWELGCNPGGQVAFWGPYTDGWLNENVPETERRRLLSREDMGIA